MDEDAKPKPYDAEKQEPLLVVGVGASAGGYEAFRELLEALPEKCGFAIVFVQHLDPVHETMLPSPVEAQALYQDLVISVTSFFRDPEVFSVLKDELLPKLLQGRAQHAPLRVWVPGCSTGEEVYSLVITLLEYLGKKAPGTPMQVFGTDISDAGIEHARAGIYPESIEADVSPERLRRFFQKRDAGYQITKPVRDLCVFARQNVFKDPPFSNLDLISCRNVLIYFAPELQKRVLPMFHYALNPSGYLILGGSESIGAFADLFAPAHSKQKIFAKHSVPQGTGQHFSRIEAAFDYRALLPQIREEPARGFDPQREADRLLLDRYGPPSVLVDEGLNIVQFRGRTGTFLEPAPGAASLNLLRMAREGLMVALHSVIHEASARGVAVRKERVRFKDTLGFARVDLQVIPILGPGDHYYLVLFENAQQDAAEIDNVPQAAAMTVEAVRADDELSALRQELAATKEYLQSVIESQESFNARRTRRSCRQTRSCRARTRSSKPPRRSCNRRTRSSPPSTRSCTRATKRSPRRTTT